MNISLLKEIVSFTTENVAGYAPVKIKNLLDQNKKRLELPKNLQVQNSLMVQKLCQKETPQ